MPASRPPRAPSRRVSAGRALALACSMRLQEGRRGQHVRAPAAARGDRRQSRSEREVVRTSTYTGIIEASETVDLRASVQGFLEKINFQPGQRVKKGDVLFEIDKRQYRRRRPGQGAVQAAGSGAGRRGERRAAGAGAGRPARGPGDRRGHQGRAPRCREGGSRQGQASSTRRSSTWSTARPRPDRRADHQRNFVDAGNLVGRGEPTLLARSCRRTPAYVSIDASEADVLAVRRNRIQDGEGNRRPSPADFARQLAAVRTGPRTTKRTSSSKGGVDYVDPQLNAQTGTLRVRTRYDNEDETLLPGLFAGAIRHVDARRDPGARGRASQRPAGPLRHGRERKGRGRAPVITIGPLDGTDARGGARGSRRRTGSSCWAC
jgi:multidrug efflux pump subunit AcrA (membrane-fusion protein)